MFFQPGAPGIGDNEWMRGEHWGALEASRDRKSMRAGGFRAAGTLSCVYLTCSALCCLPHVGGERVLRRSPPSPSEYPSTPYELSQSSCHSEARSSVRAVDITYLSLRYACRGAPAARAHGEFAIPAIHSPTNAALGEVAASAMEATRVVRMRGKCSVQCAYRRNPSGV